MIVSLELLLPGEQEREIIDDFKLKFHNRHSSHQPNAHDGCAVQITDDHESNLADVVSHLKKIGYPLENCFVSFYSPIFTTFINCGLDPLPQSIKITKDDIYKVDQKQVLKLKFQWGIRSDYRVEDQNVDEEIKQEEN